MSQHIQCLCALSAAGNRAPRHVAAHLQGHLLERDDEVAQQPAPVPAAHLPPGPQRLSELRQPQAYSLPSRSMLAGLFTHPPLHSSASRSACLPCHISGMRTPLLLCLPQRQHLRQMMLCSGAQVTRGLLTPCSACGGQGGLAARRGAPSHTSSPPRAPRPRRAPRAPAAGPARTCGFRVRFR